MEELIVKTKQSVYDYLINELNLSEKASESMFKKVSKYKDIYEQFIIWLEVRSFTGINLPEICEYTPEKLSEQFPHLKGIGVFNILVDLIDNTEKALDRLNKGLVRK